MANTFTLLVSFLSFFIVQIWHLDIPLHTQGRIYSITCNAMYHRRKVDNKSNGTKNLCMARYVS